MNDTDLVQKALKTIEKKGDLYDAIAKAKNLKPSSFGFGRFHILLLSRILFAGILAKDKAISYFAPVEKIHSAQEDIRSTLGFNIDIVREKGYRKVRHTLYEGKRKLSVLYEDSNAYMEEYISNTQKILAFCDLYKIDSIYLSLRDLVNLFPGINLSTFTSVSRNVILCSVSSSEEEEDFLTLNINDLKRLITIISGYRLDKRFIEHIGSRINDLAIKNAIKNFEYDGDVLRLKNILLSRLCLNINSDSSYKTREQGKTYDTVSINGEFIRIVSNSKNGQNPKVTIMPLCEYLGYPNFDALLNSLNKSQDDEEKLLISALYLYLCRDYKITSSLGQKSVSYYDVVYESYLDIKQSKKKENVANMYTKSYKFASHILSYIVSLYFTAVICGVAALTGLGLDAINILALGNEDSDILKTITDYVIMPYKYSWNLEKEILDVALDNVDNARIDLSDSLSSFIGDSFGIKPNENKVVGSIRPLNDTQSCDLPHYYAAQYATSSEYSKGNITYDLKDLFVDYNEVYTAVSDALEVETYFSRGDIRQMIEENHINIPLALYPVDGNYFLTSITIYDEKDKEKVFYIDSNFAFNTQGDITDEQKDLLLSMKRPVIKYTYGTIDYYFNSFASNIEKDGGYLNTTSDKMRAIITENLGLSNNASIEEIYEAIKNKDYSLTPLKDAGLSREIKDMNEEEFIGTLASLDSLICNFAATLAVEANDDLVYVVGFYSSDETITYGNAHAWAMQPGGCVIDVTPTNIEEKEEEKSIIDNIFAFASSAKLPLLMAVFLASVITYKTLGKKIIFRIRFKEVNRLLSSSKMGEAYSLINEALYGGISIPIKRSPQENLNMITKDFEGYTKEELTDLLNTLKESQKREKHLALKVIKSVPYIKKNERALKRSLNNPNKRR